MDFLPKDYEKPSTANQYMKLEEGDNKMRILTPATIGWIDWTPERKPIRTKNEPDSNFDPEKPAKHFWAFAIWDYRDEKVKIMEITQSTIQGALMGFVSDESWGDPTKYDVNIKRDGKEMATKYNIVTTPPKEPNAQVKDAIKHMTCDLDKLFDGGDPFMAKPADPTNPDNVKIDIKENEVPTVDTVDPFDN